MSGREKGKKPTRIILIRHLNTEAAEARQQVREDPQFQTLDSLLHQDTLSEGDLSQISKLGTQLARRYPLVPGDAELSILPGQEEIGKGIGRRLVEKYGTPDLWIVSPLRRARETSRLLREGIAAPPKEKFNKNIREKSFGDSDRYPSFRIYLAQKVGELKKYVRDFQRYRFPGGESTSSFTRRIKRQVRALGWRRTYEGKSTVMVTHGGVIKVMRSLLLRESHSYPVPVGGVTVLEALPKRFLRRRQFRLISQPGQPR